MSGRPDHQTFLEVQAELGLPSTTLVEKDWHVVRALAAIHDVTTDGLSLVFGGGTSLGRAYGLLERMSEDIDLRIAGALSNGGLRRLRHLVSERLEAAGFVTDGHVKVLHKGEYIRYDLPYDTKHPGTGVLRPEIKIELAAFPMLRAPVTRSVCSFVAEATHADPEIEGLACVSVGETAADKFVALTRRGGEILSGLKPFDPTLVRHIYDQSRTRPACDLADTASLAREIMIRDAAERAEGYAAYAADPLGETLRIVGLMATDKDFIDSYDRLMAEMVYGERPGFEEAFGAIQEMANGLTIEA